MSELRKYPCVVTMATSDSSGGAGIQADIKTISATGSYAASVITALTAQNTQHVQAILEIPENFITQQIDAVLSDIEVHAIKIGMLYNKGAIDAVKAGLNKFNPKNIVLDPVMISKSGSVLLQPEMVNYLQQFLFAEVDLITPNLSEAETLLGVAISNITEMETAAKQMSSQYHTNVLLKGGHLDTDYSADLLYLHQEGKCHWFYSDRIYTKNTHGTGCTLSSAIASYLAQDYLLLEAVEAAKEYLLKAIKAGSKFSLGHGHGPVHHFYARD